jgi:hypothetical protein
MVDLDKFLWVAGAVIFVDVPSFELLCLDNLPE